MTRSEPDIPEAGAEPNSGEASAGNDSTTVPRLRRIFTWQPGRPRLAAGLGGTFALVIAISAVAGMAVGSESDTEQPPSAAALAAADDVRDVDEQAGRGADRDEPTTEPGDEPSDEPTEVPTPAAEGEDSVEPQETEEPEETETSQESGTSEESAPQTASAGCGSYSGNQLTACNMLGDYGFDSGQMDCLVPLWDHESGWNEYASNPSSGAYGIPQALPGDKMATAGSDWQDNAATQIEWGLGYIADRYGSPCGAWSFWQSNNWY